AYGRFLPNLLRAIYVYSLDSGQSKQVTDGMSDARYPAFDRDGQYLYFTASTNFGPSSHSHDMTSDEHRVTRSVYAMVLPADAPSPVVPETDEEKPADSKPESRPGESKAAESAPKTVRIDFDGLQRRTVALPIPARDYNALSAGRAGQIYLLEGVSDAQRGIGQADDTLWKFDLKTRKTERLAEHLRSFILSANGDKMLLQLASQGGAADSPAAQQPHQWVIVSA